jgi:hypothetical protein
VLVNQFDIDVATTDKWLDDIGKKLITFHDEEQRGV